MKKKNIAIFEIVCYVVAALFAIIAIYMMGANIKAMNEYLAQYGVSFLALGGQAIQTLITAAGPFFAYAFLTFAAGRIYHVVANLNCDCDCDCECECDCEEVLELEAPVEALEAPAEEAVETVETETVEAVEEAVVAEETVEAVEPVVEAVETEENEEK